MGTVRRNTYTLELTVKVTIDEEVGDIDHWRLREELHRLYPNEQEVTIGGYIHTEVTHRRLFSDSFGYQIPG